MKKILVVALAVTAVALFMYVLFMTEQASA